MTAEAALQLKVEAARCSPAYRNYERARERVLAMKDQTASTGLAAPSAYWREELANVEYMLDASPLVVEKLRHHCYHVTGVWPYNYRSHKDRPRDQHAQKLEALVGVGGRDLFVAEPSLLGGFGFEIDGALVNIDTLKFFEVLIALDRAAVLGGFRERAERSYVCEIGPGWGGFAYQFKTLFPNTTYVLADLPELFVYSATYLMTAFPDARVSFYGADGVTAEEIPWAESDFVFIPNDALDVVRPPRLDLVVNMVSFQEMTTGQVTAYVEHAYEAGAPYLYSLNRERSLYNPELAGVSGIIATRYWPHRIDVLPVSYGQMLDGKGKKAKKIGDALSADNDYKHIVGWRRMQV